MKRYISVFLFLLILLNLLGCNTLDSTEPRNADHDPTVGETQPVKTTAETQVQEKTDAQQVTHPVEVKQYPEVPDIWTVCGQEHILLRGNPNGTDTLCWIPPGEQMQLLGWEGVYAHVRYEDMEGYVMSCFIMPADASWLGNSLGVVGVTSVYTYTQMRSDMELLALEKPYLVTVDIIGYSECGLPIPVMRIGNPDASRHVLLQGAIHGREHMTAWLLMAMADCWLSQGIFTDDVCVHIIPMSNPDGVQISQSGSLNEEQLAIYRKDRQRGYTNQDKVDYAVSWKANAFGIDINRNFSSGWYSTQMRKAPSSQRHGGYEPFCAAEAIALRDYTLSYPFDITISYHSSGSVIYYEYGTKQLVNRASKELALAVKDITGYPLEGSGGVDGAGYKDWAIDEMQIPSLTIEIGCKDSPLAENEIYSIFARNLFVLPMLMERLQ